MKIELNMFLKPNESPQKISLIIDMENSRLEIHTKDIEKIAGIETVYLQDYTKLLIKEKENGGHYRTAEAYISALNSFNRFANNQPIPLINVTPTLMENYEEYLKKRDICMNTISFYMRILKAVYKKAVRQELIVNKKPFENVYTGVAKTKKRALDIESIKKIKYAETLDEMEQMAQKLFLFSFYTRGMSFVDMAYLKKSDVKNGVLQYKRRKTGQRIIIKWEPVMQEIVNSFKSYNEVYLMPIIRNVGKGERNQYRYLQYLINKKLTELGKRLQLPCELTMYVSRHSWATIAKYNDVPLSVISDAMGHSSEKMTNIYLKSLNESIIDETNSKIIKLVDKL